MTKLITGVLFGSIIGFAAAQLFGEIGIAQAIGAVAAHYGSIAIAGGSVLLTLVVLYVFRDPIARWIFGKATREWDALVRDTSDAIDDLAERRYGDLKDRLTDVGQSVVATVVLWFARATLARVLIALVVASAGVFGTYVLVQQNDLIRGQTVVLERQEALLENQNTLVEDQTTIAVVASHLQTASRRTVYAREVSAIIAELNAAGEFRAVEIAQDQRESEAEQGTPPNHFADVPDELAVRINNILPLLTPYVVVEFNSEFNGDLTNLENLILRHVSPERGAILRALMSNRFRLGSLSRADPSPFDELPNFEHADMRNFRFRSQRSLSDLGCDTMQRSNTDEFVTWRSGLYDLTRVNVYAADWSGAYLSDVEFTLFPSSTAHEFDNPLVVASSYVSVISALDEDPPMLPPMAVVTSTLDLSVGYGLGGKLSGMRILDPCPNSIFVPRLVTPANSSPAELLSGVVFTTSVLDQDLDSDQWRAFVVSRVTDRIDADTLLNSIGGEVIPATQEGNRMNLPGFIVRPNQ